MSPALSAVFHVDIVVFLFILCFVPDDIFPKVGLSLPQIEEKLVGIKGQYLLFDNNTVFNVRRHSGYFVQFSY